MRHRADLLARQLDGRAGLRLLEFGCGAGIFTQVLAERFPEHELVAVDIAPKAVEVAARRCEAFPRVSVAVADVSAADFPEAGFDAIVGNSVLHHVPLAESLAAARRALRPGGLLWFSEPNMLNPQVALERNVRWIGRRLDNSPDETAFVRWPLKRQLEGAGFAAVRITPFDFVHPAIPKPLLPATVMLAAALERIPLLREIAGSLEIVAKAPLEGRGSAFDA